MACGGGSRETYTSSAGTKTNRWILHLPVELKDDFPRFALKIGFTDTQVQIHQDAEKNLSHYHLLMEKWLHTIGRHTTKHRYPIYTALKDMEKDDLLVEHFGSGAPEQYSDNNWQDFLAELQAVDMSNVHQQDEDINRTVTKKKKKKRPNRKGGNDTVNQTNIYCTGNVIVGDNNIMTTTIETPSSPDDADEEIRRKIHDILKTHGAVGGDNKRNTIILQTLEACFHKKHGKSFKSENGNPLLTFLQKAPDTFILTMSGSQWFVHMRAPMKVSQTHETNEGSKSNFPSISKESSKTKQDENQKSTGSNTTNIPTLVRPTYDHKQEREYIPNKCSKFNEFLQSVDHFRGGNYVLLISKTDLSEHVDALANIPWLCVFDFDVDSRTEDGLFFRIEDVFRKHRGALYPCTWCDPPNIQTFGTEWCFISGLTIEPESRTPEKIRTWYPHIKCKFEEHVKQINNMLDTVKILTVVACWPEDKATGMKFQRIISILTESIGPPPQVVVVGNPSAEQEQFIDMIEPDYILKEKLEHVFHDLATNLGPYQQPKELKYRLPTDDGTKITLFNDNSAASFRESMDILYLDNPSPNSSCDLSASEEEERLFFKGGTLSWQSYYNNGPGHFYVNRDLLPTIVKDIRTDFIDTPKPGLVKVFHAPGAGGTTLGQNIIWELHELTPCVQIRTDSLANHKQIADHISILYNETHRPIVVLFDDTDDYKIEQIQQQLNREIVVFIHLKRVAEDKCNLEKNEYFLKGHLSAEEARRMGPTFIRCCHENAKKKDQIQKLVDEVEKGVNHHLIEFGLVIHLQEFKGVATYVAEYLKLDKQNRKLNQHQRVLGYLSLVQFFGQGIMPCQMFGTMLGKSADYKITYNNFPSSIREFTVPIQSGFIQNSVRICHVLIAREILDQLLSRVPINKGGLDLSQLAKNHLLSFVLEFIKDLKTRQDQTVHISKTVLDIIIQTFIYREGFSADMKLRKRQFSRLIESIPSEQPFTERLQVMETLAESFPSSPSLWAHLGRAYSLPCPTQYEKTEEFFQKAIAGCQAEDSQTDSKNDDPDVVLSYVLHMYGMFYFQRVKAEILKCRKQEHPEMTFQKVVKDIFTLAETACKAFSDCRKSGFAGFQESFGCTGEINVRLLVCELIKGHYQFDTIKHLLEQSKNGQIVSFVERSLLSIMHLFMKCYNTVDQSHIDQEFYRRVTRYKIVFKGMVPLTYIDKEVPDSFQTRCAQIIGIKNKYGAGDRIGTINDIKDERDIKRIVELLEQNIDDVKEAREKHSNMDVEFLFIDWIHAIRHPQQKRYYKLEDVLTNVRYWSQRMRSPYSKFYLFVLLCTLGVNPRVPCDENILREAMKIKKEDIDGKKIGKQFSDAWTPREWLGREDGIRCLQQGNTFKNHIEGKIINDESANYNLAVLKGTIKPPNKYRQHGHINVSVHNNPTVPVQAPFCPFRTTENLVGMKYAGYRVQFVLAFTAQSGFEAYNVKLLKKSTCKCGEQIEIVSVERYSMCKKCNERVENEFPINNSSERQVADDN